MVISLQRDLCPDVPGTEHDIEDEKDSGWGEQNIKHPCTTARYEPKASA
jgi:hypothetical protein